MNVAFVIQRYGDQVLGGGETHCRLVAQLVARTHRVEVLTSCAEDYITWQDVYPPGTEQDGTVTVRRFSVPEPRDIVAFNRLSERVLLRPTSPDEQERWVRAQGPYMPGLIDWLRKESARYDVVVLFTYDYAHTYFGASEVVGAPKVIMPLAHDNRSIRLPCYKRTFVGAAGAVFNTPEERALCQAHFGALPPHTAVISVGCEAPTPPDPQRFWERFGAQLSCDRFVLYVGRIEESKGCADLISFFERYRHERSDTSPALVLAGPKKMPLPDRPWLRYLGVIEEQMKFDAFAACAVHVVPSPNESLSMAALEGWLAGRPLLANGACAVLAGQCRRSNGGLYYTGYQEFASALEWLLANKGASDRLGALGQRYTVANYRWDVVERRWLTFLERVAGNYRRVMPVSTPKSSFTTS